MSVSINLDPHAFAVAMITSWVVTHNYRERYPSSTALPEEILEADGVPPDQAAILTLCSYWSNDLASVFAGPGIRKQLHLDEKGIAHLKDVPEPPDPEGWYWKSSTFEWSPGHQTMKPVPGEWVRETTSGG